MTTMDQQKTTQTVTISQSNGSLNEFNTSSTIELATYSSPENKQKENEAYDQRDLTKATSDVGSVLHVIKSSLGSGILAIPNGFSHSGILVGIISTVVVGILCTHCIYLVVKCAQDLCYMLKKPCLCYAEAFEETFNHGAGGRLRKYSKLARKLLDVFQFITYYGLNTIYVIVIASSFQEALEHQLHYHLNIRCYILILTIFLLPYGQIRHMKYLVPFSAIANGLLTVGLIITMYYITQDLPPISSRKFTAPITELPLFLSLLFLAMEGIGTVMPIENAMKNPHHFLGCPGVMNISMIIVVSIYVIIGFFGYLKYGDEADGSITFNLPHDWLCEAVKICIGIAIYFTYTLQLTASIEVVWNNVKHKYTSCEDRAYYTIRGLLILGTILIAAAVPNLAPVISLVGAVGFATLGVTIPAVMETVLYWEDGLGRYNWKLWKNILLLIISLFALVAGSISSIIEIINEYKL
ncbi:proton-coupled amino acid transporter-like protein pathetic [Lycorma delicatula]|uniref:proton-coupled amino acid transporter-like protein pathetic n=1 Tax=Lycorma delicatula TaxID=130591 RepID=UPI003F5100E2